MSPWISRRARDERKRAVVKTLTYRVFMLLITAGVALAITGDLGAAVEIGVGANLLKTGTYYLYERFWARIGWGTTGGSAFE